MKTVFQSMVDQLVVTDISPIQTITGTQYENFLKDFTFDKLKGMTLGESFCRKYGIVNMFLLSVKDEKELDNHIKKFYIKT